MAVPGKNWTLFYCVFRPRLKRYNTELSWRAGFIALHRLATTHPSVIVHSLGNVACNLEPSSLSVWRKIWGSMSTVQHSWKHQTTLNDTYAPSYPVLLSIVCTHWCLLYVAVPSRNRTVLCCTIQPHYCVPSVVAGLVCAAKMHEYLIS